MSETSTVITPFFPSFFTKHGKLLSHHAFHMQSLYPFKEHAQFDEVIDILIRKQCHHVIINTDFSPSLQITWLTSFLKQLTHDNTPTCLRDTKIIYINLETLSINEADFKSIEDDFSNLLNELTETRKYLLFALASPAWLTKNKETIQQTFLRTQFERIATHPTCRLLLLTANSKKKHYLPYHFYVLKLAQPDENDLLLALRHERESLEQHHHVLIPDEILQLAYVLSKRYLSAQHLLDKTLLLLDSSAARLSQQPHVDNQADSKPILTTAMLMNTLSTWVRIPATHLQINQAKFTDITHHIHQSILGQEAAASLVSQALQQAYAQLFPKPGPFCSFLFAGPEHTGKKTMALNLAEQLFKQPHAFYLAETFSLNLNSLIGLKLRRHTDNVCFTLQEVISTTPYALILFENIERFPGLQAELHEILTTGYLHDTKGHRYDFHQSILIFSTCIGSHRLTELTRSLSNENETDDMDLMQLIMHEAAHSTFDSTPYYTPKDLIAEIMPEINAHLPTFLYQQIPIIPFLPLSRSALENLVRLKLKSLGKMLDNRFNIELSYAPEVVRYLANEITFAQEKETNVDADKSLEPLYITIEQAIFSQAENKHRPQQLFLQLNETGQLLKYDWLNVSTIRHHAS